MNVPSAWISLFCAFVVKCFVFFLLAAPLMASGAEGGPHGGRGTAACTICHVAPAPGGQSSGAQGPGSVPDSACLECHANAMAGSHPIGVPHLKPLATPLPLGANRQLVCGACHEAHGPTGQRGLLRDAPDRLCRICHDM